MRRCSLPISVSPASLSPTPALSTCPRTPSCSMGCCLTVCLSIKNEWYDDTGRVYIYYTVDEIGSNLNCGRDKAMKLLAELDTGKGVGLIERIKQGQGKPTRIYVKRFTTQELPPQPEKKPEPPTPPPGVEFTDVQTSDFPISRGRDFRRAEVAETDSNQTIATIKNKAKS